MLTSPSFNYIRVELGLPELAATQARLAPRLVKALAWLYAVPPSLAVVRLVV